MSKGFVIEFSVDVADDGDDPDVERFRVLVDAGGVRAFEAFAGPFGETRWLEANDSASNAATVDKYKIVGWAFEGYVRAPSPADGLTSYTELPNGLTLITIGTVKREE